LRADEKSWCSWVVIVMLGNEMDQQINLGETLRLVDLLCSRAEVDICLR
jgi:hypothetical protein